MPAAAGDAPAGPDPDAPLVTRHARVPPSAVWDAIVDPSTYPEWLAGCREIRSIDDGWPEPGTRFHHRVGLAGPITTKDHTVSLEVEAPRHLALEVRFRPFGRGRVDFVLTDEGTVADPRTRIDMYERLIGAASPAQPAAAPLIVARNRASLNALVAYLNAPPASS